MNNTNVKVSVIIPAFNAGKYIEEALNSVFSQTYRQFEIIMVDDCSTDNTKEILEKYKSKIHLITLQTNQGEAHARNTAINEAQGEYISFLDADDMWRPTKLEKQVSYLDAHPEIGFLYSNATCFKVVNNEKQIIREFHLDFTGDVFKELFWSNFVPGHTPMVRADILKTVGLFDENVRLKKAAADYDLWLRISRVTNFGHLSEVLADYRIHDTNMLGLSYENVLLPYEYIYEKFYTNYPDTDQRIGLSKNACIGDLYLRHAFMDFISKNQKSAITKAKNAIKYIPFKGFASLMIIIIGIKSPQLWKHLLWRFDIIYSKFVKTH